MFVVSTITLFVALRLLLSLVAPSSLVEAVPTPQTPIFSNDTKSSAAAASGYWLANIQRQGTVAYSNNDGYQVYRNIRDFGAVGDGVKDDTAAITAAINAGNRCGQGCDSSTIKPALVYFPPGTYLVSSPLIQLYYTQFVGDAVNLPVIKAAPSFQGIAVMDSDPYDNTGKNWYTNQNNFFRQIRNFVIDLTAMPPSSGTGMHWQVAQATSLQNIRFEMIRGGDNNRQQGIFMDNGSGGFMSDLTFNGGNYGAFLGNQQFTTRNLVFNDCKTAIFMNWNWAWSFKSLTVNNCGIGIDMANGGLTQTVGSVLVLDSKFSNTAKAIVTSFGPGSRPATGGTLIIDNTDFTSSPVAVASNTGATILNGGSVVASWAQGNAYTSQSAAKVESSKNNTKCAEQDTDRKDTAAAGSRIQGALRAPGKPSVLLGAGGKVFERSKPQYENLPASAFISVKSSGAKGDGVTDDTAAIQAIFDRASPDSIVYFDHGAYVVSDTVRVPNNIKITGEIWPLIMASGAAFSDQNQPKPVFQVGRPGERGAVEMSDLMFETIGPQPGAILLQWNLNGDQGANGMWDVHFRVAGSAGTKLQSDTCSKNPSVIAPPNPACVGAFMLLHVTREASVYLENTWFWVADHELDLPDFRQINIYNGRGVLVEAQNGVWMYGTSSEHNQLYQYQIANAKNVYMALIQTETPYMQANPNALVPFTPNQAFNDPTYSTCTTDLCRKSWGLRIIDSSDIYMYGGGLYSFFENYGQTCLETESCQENMVSLEGGKSSVYLYGLSTKASTNQVTVDGRSAVSQADNRNNFCSTVALFNQS